MLLNEYTCSNIFISRSTNIQICLSITMSTYIYSGIVRYIDYILSRLYRDDNRVMTLLQHLGLKLRIVEWSETIVDRWCYPKRCLSKVHDKVG